MQQWDCSLAKAAKMTRALFIGLLAAAATAQCLALARRARTLVVKTLSQKKKKKNGWQKNELRNHRCWYPGSSVRF